MKRILLLIILLIFSSAYAYSFEGETNLTSFGISAGSFMPQEINYGDIYEDKRDTTFALSYDKEIAGNLALGGSLMYFGVNGTGVNSALDESAADTKLIIAKGELSAIYRFIQYDEQLFVPQFKAGLSCTYFNEKITDGGRTENAYLGYHGGFALLMLLDRLDPENAKDLEMDFGVKDTYLFVGVDYSNTDDFKENKLNLSGVEYNAGLMFRY